MEDEVLNYVGGKEHEVENEVVFDYVDEKFDEVDYFDENGEEIG